MAKELYVKDLLEKVGEEVAGLFILQSLKDNLNTKGTKSADCVYSDCTGVIKGKIWDDVFDSKFHSYVGRIVKIVGAVTLYDGIVQLTVTAISPVASNEYFLDDFIKQMDDDTFNVSCNLIRNYIESMNTPLLKSILQMAFTEKMLSNMRQLPAGIIFHHAYNGGLLDHTLEVARISDTLCGLYFNPQEVLRRDLVITAALLHDVGKVKEYTPFPLAQRTTSAVLTGFVSEGVSLVEKLYGKLQPAGTKDDASKNLMLNLKHIILTCHATQGSQKPKTKEALIVSYADEASAGVNAYDTAEKRYDEEHPGNEDQEFSSRYFGYSLYRELPVQDGGAK